MSVNLWISSTDTHSERKLDLSLQIGQLKVRARRVVFNPLEVSDGLGDLQGKLERITGIPYDYQSLSLWRSDEGELVGSLEGDDERSLGSFGIVGQSLFLLGSCGRTMDG